MALRGTGGGGCSFTLPAAFDDTADLSAFLWVRRSSTAAAGARIFSLYNANRSRGFIVHLGGTVGGTSLASDVVVSASSAFETSWGAAANQGGRGRAVLPGLSDADFCALAFSVRGVAAADNTATGGALQLHEVWWKGAPAAVATTTVGSGIANLGGRAFLLCRDAATLNAFNGWVAEVTVWQGHRLSAAEAQWLSRGGTALAVAPDKLLFHRSFRSGLAAEAGDTALTMIGSGTGLEALTHPPLLLESMGAAHASAAAAPMLAAGTAQTAWLSAHGGRQAHGGQAARLVVTGAPPLAPAQGRHGHRAGAAGLTAAALRTLELRGGRHGVASGTAVLAARGRLQVHGRRLALAGGAASLLPVAGAADVLRVPQEARLMKAGIF